MQSFLWNIKSLTWLNPPTAQIWRPETSGFPKTKIAFEREEISDIDEIQENSMGQLMAIDKIVWGPKVPTLKGNEASLSYVQCFLYLLQ